jgi:superfamily II DNA or RNA helicase
MQNFKDINFPLTAQYSSDSEHIPLEFYENAIPKAKTMDMVLGYFSTNAIQTLCLGFSEFIYLGGSLRIVTNHQLTQEDKHNLLSEPTLNNENQIIDIFQDLRRLKEELGPFGQHFFDCLKFLLKKKRLIVQPVMHKPNAMAHYKKIILFDGENYLYVSGSANFTTAGIIKNGESFIVDQSWGGETEKLRIQQERKNFDLIFEKKHASYDYLNPEEVIGIIQHIGNDLTELELLEKTFEMTKCFSQSERIKKIIDKRTIEFQNLIDETEKKPKFPYPDGPRDYQVEAYQNWIQNDYKGLFAMATGTGKTLTSLNCILQQYKIFNYYKFLVLVPSISLANQWSKEVKEKFRFTNTIICSSKTKNWEKEIKRLGQNLFLDNDKNYSIILTYATFNSKKFRIIFEQLFKSDFDKLTLIADEAHTMGSPGFLKQMPTYIKFRIGLSATPERQFDELGEKVLNSFFNTSAPNYTFTFNMYQAIEQGILCRYLYYPRIVELERDELDSYIEISKKLIKFFDSSTGRYKDNDYVNLLLIKRKSIIHKARNKVVILNEIVREIGKTNFTNAFIYVPEGIDPDYAEVDYSDENDLINEDLIDVYTSSLYDNFKLKLKKFTGKTNNREEIIEQFKENKVDALLAMKCLDEGIDIPQTKYAIFCSSTGNPRQFVQRRGRVLRTHKGKEVAIIYDMIVKPILDVTATDEGLKKVEKNIFLGELRRFINFAVLAENKSESLKELEEIANSLDIDIYAMEKEELQQYNLL